MSFRAMASFPNEMESIDWETFFADTSSRIMCSAVILKKRSD